MNDLIIEAAHPGELAQAFQLLFQHCPPDEAARRLINGLEAIERGDLDPAGIIVARGALGLHGVLACLPVPGASGLVWPPQVAVATEMAVLEDRLIRHALGFLQQRGAKIVQAILTPEEAPQATPLLRHGFQHITTLDFLRHPLDQQTDETDFANSEGTTERLTYHAYDDTPVDKFHETLLRTYEGGLDCPELNNTRDVHDIIAGHQAQGRYDPQRWWLVREQDRPVGVLLLNEMPDWHSLEISYLGVVRECRGRGFGRELVERALRTARAAGVHQVTLTVDRRNLPARNLYTRLGFHWFDEREVLLTILA